MSLLQNFESLPSKVLLSMVSRYQAQNIGRYSPHNIWYSLKSHIKSRSSVRRALVGSKDWLKGACTQFSHGVWNKLLYSFQSGSPMLLHCLYLCHACIHLGARRSKVTLAPLSKPRGYYHPRNIQPAVLPPNSVHYNQLMWDLITTSIIPMYRLLYVLRLAAIPRGEYWKLG